MYEYKIITDFFYKNSFWEKFEKLIYFSMTNYKDHSALLTKKSHPVYYTPCVCTCRSHGKWERKNASGCH